MDVYDEKINKILKEIEEIQKKSTHITITKGHSEWKRRKMIRLKDELKKLKSLQKLEKQENAPTENIENVEIEN